jgi:hypothetical protein
MLGSLERDVRPYFKDIESARASLVKMLEQYQRGPMPERSVRPRDLPDAGDGNEPSKSSHAQESSGKPPPIGGK